MQRAQEDTMSKEEIIKYVDDLIKANKRYDKRLAQLLYDLFFRANEKFEWSREEFLEKYQNFRNNVKIIKFKRLEGNVTGRFNGFEQVIYIDKAMLKNMQKNSNKDLINDIIDTFFHECSHATDLTRNNGRIVSDRTL